jgi:hypothetical protein
VYGRRRLRRRVLPLTLVAFLAACGSNAHNISESQLSKLVLQEQDLPAAYSPFNSGPQVRLDNQGSPRSDVKRFGRKGGWIARFSRPGDRATSGPLVVESRADLFADADGARSDLDAYGEEFRRTPTTFRYVEVRELGDAADGITFRQAGGIRYFRIAWRDRNVTAAVTIQGFEGKIQLGEALALARKQDKRIAAAP